MAIDSILQCLSDAFQFYKVIVGQINELRKESKELNDYIEEVGIDEVVQNIKDYNDFYDDFQDGVNDFENELSELEEYDSELDSKLSQLDYENPNDEEAIDKIESLRREIENFMNDNDCRQRLSWAVNDITFDFTHADADDIDKLLNFAQNGTICEDSNYFIYTLPMRHDGITPSYLIKKAKDILED